jgi:hypothetical protein
MRCRLDPFRCRRGREFLEAHARAVRDRSRQILVFHYRRRAEPLLDQEDKLNTLVFQVDLFSARGVLPRDHWRRTTSQVQSRKLAELED